MSSLLDLSIIIVNYKTPDLTIRCIDSIYATTKCNFEVIVVDNASMDDSKERICTAFPKVIWIQNKENDGFGRANNLGVANSRGKYILLLNSDMVLTDDCIDHCLRKMAEYDIPVVYACRLVNADGSLQRNAYYDIVSIRKMLNNSILYVKLFGEIKQKPNEEIKALMGAFMLIPLDMFKEVNGFDPDFFMYCEEMDLCRRLASKGCRFRVADDVYAIHKHEGSSSNKQKTYAQRLLSESLLVYKVRGWLFYAMYHFVFINIVVTNLIISIFARKYKQSVTMVVKAYFNNFWRYFTIPFEYRRGMGDGKRMLKVN